MPDAVPPVLERVDWADLPDWANDDHALAFEAFRRSAHQALIKPYRSGSLGIMAGSFSAAFAEARLLADLGPVPAKKFFETHFAPFRIRPEQSAPGLVTGFYEPVAQASHVRTDEFRYPVLARPADLEDVTDANRPDGMDPYLAFARRRQDGLTEYFDRQAVESGALDGLGLEFAWLKDKVDLFFIHVQGAARLIFPDGNTLRITYAAKTGQRFTGPGHVLASLGEIPLQAVTMQSIRAWFKANPRRVDEILWRNRSYIFFRAAPVDDPGLGPIAAAKVPLTAGRSMAVDRLLHTFATPFFVSAPGLTAFDGKPFARLMIAQDTGSAIVGPARGDLFAGSGDAAGEIAGVVRAPADFWVLVPRALPGVSP